MGKRFFNRIVIQRRQSEGLSGMKIDKIGWGIVVFILLAGCQGQPTASPTATILPTAAPTRPAATATSLPPTSTAAPSSTPTQAAAWKNNLEKILMSPCVDVEPSLPENIRIDYDLVIREDQNYFVFDPVSQQKTAVKVPDQDIKLSPDGKWLAYKRAKDRTLVVEPVNNLLKNDAKKQIELKKYNWFYLVDWLSSDKIILLREAEDQSHPTVIYNPFTKEIHEYFLKDYLEARKFTDASAAMPFIFTQYNLLPDPTLTKMIFAGNENEMFPNVTLWDIENKKILGKVAPFIQRINNDPLWSQDGSDFVMASDQRNWHQVTREGRVRQLTKFNDFLKEMFFVNASRSPDGRYLSFEIYYKSLNGDKGQKYLILDLKSDAVDGFCVDASPDDYPDSRTMVWSPDRKYLAVSDVTNKILGNVMLVDVDKKQSYLMTKDVSVIGWLVKP
jgi:hypothetical protein